MIFGLGAISSEFRYGQVGLLLMDIAVLLGFLLATSCLLLAGYVLSVAYCSDFWVLLGFSLITYCMSYLLYRKLRKPVYAKFVEASRIRDAGSPRTATLRFPGVMGWSGMLIELIDEKSSRDPNPIIALGMPRTIKAPKSDHEVRLWRDDGERSSTLVVEISGQNLIGTIRSRPDLEIELRRMRGLLTALLWVGCLAAVFSAIYLAFAMPEYGYQDSPVNQRGIFLTKWVAILVASAVLSVVFWLGRKKLLSEIQALLDRMRVRSSRVR